MNDEIKVLVKSNGPGRCLVMYYVCPISGKRIVKTTGANDQREAERAAGEWEKELQRGGGQSPSKITWADFRNRYEEEHLASLSKKTRISADFHLNQLEKHMNPDRLCKLNAAALSVFQTKLRGTGIRETSIASSLRAIKAALSWAVSMDLMPAIPRIVMPKKAKGRKMKGGALVGEQFDRMIAVVPNVRPKDADEWVRYLTGLWLSGLRLSESVALSWDADAPFAVDLTGRHPRFRIKGDSQKSGNDELAPLTPDFAQFLLQTPLAERHGRVFRLNQAINKNTVGTTPIETHHVGQIIDKIGVQSGVIVALTEKRVKNKETGKLETVSVKKFATAHDLRRTFGTRWARRVMPAVLQKLMRHANVQTTMQYYVDLNVDELADALWTEHQATPAISGGFGNTFGNTGRESDETDIGQNDVSSCKEGAY